MSLLSKTDENTQGAPAGGFAPAATHTDPAAQLGLSLIHISEPTRRS